MTAVALAIAGRRVWFLYRLISGGQPAPDRLENVGHHVGQAVKSQVVEVLGQKKLLKWTVPGAAHFFVFWAFLILATVYLEAYGALFNPEFHIPIVGTWPVLGFLQDFIAMMAFFGILVFAIIRAKNSPERLGRKSRFEGSHLGGAWLTLFMIFNVLWTMMLFRGAAINTGHLPYESGAFVSEGAAALLEPLGESANEMLEHVGLLLHIGVMLAFLILVVHSKHLHIFIAPLNVMFGRKPVALGAVKPLTIDGKPFDLEMVEEMDEDTSMGVGKVEDFTWKGMLDFATCTECGRCQDQCPAWNTEKPLSPKMVILNLRDHAFAKAPYMLADSDDERANLSADVLAEAERPLVGDTEGLAWHPEGGAIIDNDVLWSCVTCGACVNQCPVDIEHVDHIVDMRRYQVLVESNFPAELNGLFKGLENKGNPWNMSPNARMEWAQGLPFDVKVVGEDIETLDEVDWLFWVGCAGAYEDRAKKTTRAVAELLDMAGVSFGVLGNGETCTGDSARRAGNEFLFQSLATQNAETFKETKVKKVVSTCAHCFNTLKNEYAQFGVELEVVHHTQLLNRLVREGKLTPVPTNGAPKRTLTYHDPCYIGRHNQVYSPPRELLDVIPDADLKEMPRNSERSFCCGAGGARMWMEETIGERINLNRTNEAVETGADQIATGCPFCRVMLSDGLTAKQADGSAREEVEVLDVAQLLLASVKGESRAPVPAGASAKAGATTAPAAAATQTASTVTEEESPEVETSKPASSGSLFDAAPEAADKGGEPSGTTGSSLFDTPAEADEPKAEAAPAQEAAPSSAGSLFDVAPSEPEPAKAEEPAAQETEPAAKSESTDGISSGGSLFDIAPTEPEPAKAEPTAKAAAEPEAEAPAAESEPAPATEEAPATETKPAQADISSAGSLFDIAPTEPEPPQAEEPKAEASEEEPEKAPAPEATTTSSNGEANEPKRPAGGIDENKSLFDF
ncbi:MAG TPA: heterodisulfide reductase-related iron-sulfur binding cluster [Nocardioidaceae bacterium]|nr:heterodisulfide reductase-related iron-sulfur binding cluster [Nocardioidaceae bacterium]